jgi:ssDNA-binding protein
MTTEAAPNAHSDILTPVFRLSYPQLFEAKAYGKGKPEFSLIMIYPQNENSRLVALMREAGIDDASIRASYSQDAVLMGPDGKPVINPRSGKPYNTFGTLKRGVASAAGQEFGAERCQNADFVKSLRKPYRPGDDGSYATKDGFGADVVFIKATSKRDQPELLFADKRKIEKERDLYGGCFARAVISFAGYDPSKKGEPGQKGIGCYVRLVQKVCDFKSFGGGGSKASLVDDLPGSAPADPGTGSTGGAPQIGGW